VRNRRGVMARHTKGVGIALDVFDSLQRIPNILEHAQRSSATNLPSTSIRNRPILRRSLCSSRRRKADVRMSIGARTN
jgi:hypothetical protein